MEKKRSTQLPHSHHCATGCVGMHLKLSENQFREVAADFLPRIGKKKAVGLFSRHPGHRVPRHLGHRVCGDMQLSAVDEKKGDCETNKLVAKPQNQPVHSTQGFDGCKKLIKSCQRRNVKPIWLFHILKL